MRVLILIALLCNVAFSALYLSGAEYTQVVTINHSQVAETNSDFLFQLKIPRVGALLTAVESADDVAFTNVNDTTRRARWVVYTPDTIYMYSHIAVSSTVDTSYRLQYGKSLNETNAAATFTNCGITNFWGMDESSGSTTVDYAGGITGTKYNVDVISGVFNKGLLFKNNAATSTVICSSPTIGTGDISLFVNFKLTSNKNYHTLINNGKFRVQIWANGTIQVLSDGITPTTGLLYALNTEVWYCLYINRSATGIVNAWLNGGKVINNGNSGTPALGTVNLEFGRSQTLYPLDGSIDNVSLYSDQINLTSNYNSIFTPSAFFTLGNPQMSAIYLNTLSGKHNDIVDVRGQFNDTGSLYLNNTRLTTTYWTDSLIKFTVPNISRGYYNFITDIGGYRDTLSSLFRVKVPSVKIDSIRIRR